MVGAASCDGGCARAASPEVVGQNVSTWYSQDRPGSASKATVAVARRDRDGSGRGRCLWVERPGETTVTSEQAEANRLDRFRVDLAVSGSVERSSPHVAVITAGVSSLDRQSVEVPEIRVELGPAVSVDQHPDECSVIDPGVVECAFVEIYNGVAPTPPVEVELSVTVDGDPNDAYVTLTATSFNNPLDNDPDPTNNILTLELAE